MCFFRNEKTKELDDEPCLKLMNTKNVFIYIIMVKYNYSHYRRLFVCYTFFLYINR